MIGSLLKVKPLLKVAEAGVIESVEKIRTMKKALNRMAETFLEEEEVTEVAILHSNCPELAEEFKAKIVDKDQSLEDVVVYPLTPVIGAHLGTGTVGITFRKRRN
jgi:fatty acid-binding protein DegV